MIHKSLHIALFTLSCWFLATNAFPQSKTSEKGRFKVDYALGCNPLSIQITEIDSYSDTLVRQYDYNGDGIFTNKTNYTYDSAGIYTIVQIMQLSSDKFDSLTLEVKENRDPQFELLACNNNSVQLNLTGNYYDRYRVDWGDGSPADTVDQNIIHDYATQGQYNVTVEGIFANAATNCASTNEQITTVDQLEGADINSVEVLGDTAVLVNHSNLNPNITYIIEYGMNNNFGQTQRVTNATTTTINELNTANNYYCFRITALNACDTTENINSQPICSINLQTSSSNGENQLTWQTATGDFTEYNIRRDDTLINTITTPSTTNFTDPNVTCLENHQYQITGTTPVGTSISATKSITTVNQTNPPPVSNFTANINSQSVTLNWSQSGNNTYYIQKSINNGNFAVVDSVRGSTGYTDQDIEGGSTHCYKVYYRDDCGNDAPLSTEICLDIPERGQVYFPNAFTPNGDGKNDVFKPKSQLVDQYHLKIFNRWGELIFVSDNIDEGWQGNYQGSPAPEATYVYRAEIVDNLGNKFHISGTILLLRKNF